MLRYLLHARHWQVFLFSFGILVLYRIIAVLTVFAGTGGGRQPDTSLIEGFASVYPLFVFLALLVYFLWIWAVAKHLNPLIDPQWRPPLLRFRLFFFLSLFYILALLVWVMLRGGLPFEYIYLLPVHFLVMCAFIYCVFFAAKTIRLVELQRKLIFQDYFGEFVMVAMFPIGIWLLQPRVNRLAKENS